jgi:Ca2+-binding EF-hand superfamily protein
VKKTASRSGSKGRSFEEEQLVKSLKDQISFDRDLEEAKRRLALRSDFNLLDAFKIFDRKGKGFVTMTELERALHEIGLYPTKDELYLFFRRYDKDSDGLLR